MRKTVLLILTIATSFSFGFAFKTILSRQDNASVKATDIGGIFFKCKDPKTMRDWYHKHLVRLYLI